MGPRSQMSGNVQLLAFRLDERRYGLHLAQVQRVVRAVDATPLPRAPQIVWGAINLHGTILPVLNLRKRFGFAEREIGPDDHFIIARSSRRSVALVVDSTSGIIEYPSKDIVAASKILGRLDQIEGVVRLEDDLLLIHDLDRFLSLDEESELEAAVGEASAAMTGAANHGS